MKAALEFVTSMEFWRMAVLWAFYLLISYWKLFLQPNSNSNSRPSNSSPWTSPSGFRPVCVITGVSLLPCSFSSSIVLSKCFSLIDNNAGYVWIGCGCCPCSLRPRFLRGSRYSYSSCLFESLNHVARLEPRLVTGHLFCNRECIIQYMQSVHNFIRM